MARQLRKLVDNVENDYLTAVYNSKHPFSRLIWAIVGVGMVGLGVFCFVELVQDFLLFPSYTEISSKSAEEYYLPAITICNINPMNKTKMEEDRRANGGNTVYDLYRNFEGIFRNRNGKKVKLDLDYSLLDNLDLRRLFKWNIIDTIDRETFTFAKERLVISRESDLINVEYTEMGSCLELNDNQQLVQRVNGPVGGLSIVLDARTQDYLETTESEGFFVLLRMPNETVLNKEYAFAVSPGKATYVELKTTQVTRLTPPYGTCQHMDDVFSTDNTAGKEKNPLTMKECFTNQVLWQYMSEQQCKCYPWYIFSRYISREKPGAAAKVEDRNVELEDQLYKYYTEDIEEGKRIKFDLGTCYHNDQYGYTGTVLETFEKVDSAVGCAVNCKETPGCVVFMWVKAIDLEEGVSQCTLLDASAVMTDSLTYSVTRGEVNCTAVLDECGITKEANCENLVIDTMMSTNNTTTHPMRCHEPCSYNKTHFTLSHVAFPSQGYWISTLSDRYPHYRTISEARRNLVKIVFYQQLLATTHEVQTAAYNWQSFIGEAGGALDFFSCISFMTVYKLIEWLLKLIFGGRKRSSDQGEGKDESNGTKMNDMPVVSS